MAEQYKYKYTNSATELCGTCYKLIKEGNYVKLSAANKQYPCAPCYPSILDHPHSCSLQILFYVTVAHQNHSITTRLFNSWIENNSMEYHISDSQYAFNLWDERLIYLNRKKATKETILKNTDIYRKTLKDMPNFIDVYDCSIHHLKKIRFIENFNYTNINEGDTNIFHDIFPPPSKGDGNKINLPLTHLIAQMLRDGYVKDINLVMQCFHIGTIENIITMHLVNSIGNSSYHLMYALFMKDKACCLSERQYYDYTKSVGVTVRRCSRWVDGSNLSQKNICELSYWEMCLGRLTNKSDWEQEKQNRCTVPLPLKMPHDTEAATMESNAKFLTRLKPHIRSIFETILTGMRSQLSWTDFIEQRQLWITGGSAGGEKVMIDGVSRRIDKKVLFEKTTAKDMNDWLDSEPIIQAVASEKYEPGKPRAIYGASPKSYMILTYLTKDIENRLNLVEGFEDGLNELQEIEALINRMKAVAAPSVHTTMVDYADFNLQHTLEAQYLMFDVIYELMIERGFHPDMIKAADWARKSMKNQWVKFPYDSEYIKIIQGMFSGVRPTNLINTVLNKAYYLTISQIVTEEMGIQPEYLLAIHKGDDVWISNHNIIYAIALYMGLLCSNFILTPSKQLLGKHGEFLRIRYWEDHMLGYLCRALASMIERPAQSAEVSTPAVMLQGLRSQVNILYRRGLKIEACNLVWAVMERFWDNIKHPTFNNICIPKHIIRKSSLLNGLDLGAPKTLPVNGFHTASIPVIKHKLKKVAEVIPRYMTEDYMKYLSKTIKQPFKIDSVAGHIHNNNIVGAASSGEKHASLRWYANELITWKKKLMPESGIIRSRELFDEYLEYPYRDKELQNTLNQMEIRLKINKSGSEISEISTIFQAIHSSPFRDISTACRALGVRIIQAAELCILLNPDSNIRGRAYQHLSDLKRSLGDEIIVRILSNSGIASNNFESIFHPVVLAWLNTRTLSLAVRDAVMKKIKTLDEWDMILQHRQRMIISTANRQGLLLRIAGY